MSRVESLTPTEYTKRWPLDRAHSDVVLLDVRETAELELAALNFALHIPMGQVPARVDELEPEKTIVVMCHSGGRSMRVAEYLATRGFEKVVNLTGGIDAWSREIDCTVPRY